MMKRWLFLFFLLIGVISVPHTLQAQCFSPCKDSLKQENPFYTCFGDYLPICACDGKTYRNSCFAENKFAISQGCYTDGPCGIFDVDVSPNVIGGYSSLTFQFGLSFQVYSKAQSFLLVSIFNAYGYLQTNQVFPVRKYIQGNPIDAFTISTATWEDGIYICEFFLEGERKVIKVLKQPDF